MIGIVLGWPHVLQGWREFENGYSLIRAFGFLSKGRASSLASAPMLHPQLLNADPGVSLLGKNPF